MPTMDRRTLEGLRDDLAGRAPSPTRDTITMLLEVVTGYPDVDNVLAQPVAIWDRLRDLATRVERLERVVSGPGMEEARDELRTFHDDGPGTARDAGGALLTRGDRVYFARGDTLRVGIVAAFGADTAMVLPGEGHNDGHLTTALRNPAGGLELVPGHALVIA